MLGDCGGGSAGAARSFHSLKGDVLVLPRPRHGVEFADTDHPGGDGVAHLVPVEVELGGVLVELTLALECVVGLGHHERIEQPGVGEGVATGGDVGLVRATGAEIEAVISGRQPEDCEEAAGATRIKRLRDALGNQMMASERINCVIL